MRSFKTTDGTEWKISVNVATVKRCLDETGLRLTDAFGSEGNIAEFFSDDIKFAEVLLAIVRPQLVQAGKTVDDLFAGIDGTVIESAAEALLAELVDFFQEPRRGLLKSVLAKYQAAADKLKTEGLDAARQKIDATNFEQLLRQSLSQPMPTSSALSSPDAAA